MRLGSTSGSDNLIRQGVFDDGVHSIAFTPTTASIYIELFTDQPRQALVRSCQIEGSGTMVIPTPWSSADLAANLIRYRQNKDVLYVASAIYQQREIQRRGDTSWGVQRYKVDNGPYVASDGNIALSPSVYVGTGSLAATRNYFEP